jgi:8-oxo-dGTP diphosphatase
MNASKLPKPQVTCAIIEQDGRILAARRNRKQSNGGLWEFPGGKIHEQESPADALRREIREELGVSIDIINRLPACSYCYPGFEITLIPFICILLEGPPQALEHEEIRWIAISDADSLQWSPADIPVLDEYRSYCGKS